MSIYHFLNHKMHSFQGRSWQRYSDTCPYHIRHAVTLPKLKFIKAAWFRFYCNGSKRVIRRGGKYPTKRGGSEYRHGKLYKFYWAFHERQRSGKLKLW
jgi:hypothetical protein